MPLAATPWQSIWIIGIANAGAGALYTLGASDLLARMPPGRAARASAVTVCAQSASAIITNPLIGRAVDRLGDYDAVAIGLGVWLLPGCLIWVLCYRTSPA